MIPNFPRKRAKSDPQFKNTTNFLWIWLVFFPPGPSHLGKSPQEPPKRRRRLAWNRPRWMRRSVDLEDWFGWYKIHLAARHQLGPRAKKSSQKGNYGLPTLNMFAHVIAHPDFFLETLLDFGWPRDFCNKIKQHSKYLVPDWFFGRYIWTFQKNILDWNQKNKTTSLPPRWGPWSSMAFQVLCWIDVFRNSGSSPPKLFNKESNRQRLNNQSKNPWIFPN